MGLIQMVVTFYNQPTEIKATVGFSCWLYRDFFQVCWSNFNFVERAVKIFGYDMNSM